MTETLEQLLRRLVHDQAIFQGLEEATRQGAILPLLAQLGWNTYNIREVSPEYSVGTGRVDYCLHIGYKKAMYIEVKRFKVDLELHEKQLLEYAFNDGIELAVLTNGLLWWLYLPLEKGDWQQRKFFTIDIREQSCVIAAKHFLDFLSREAIANGTAIYQAKAHHAYKEKERFVRETLPRAWDEILSEPDETLISILSAKVESMCGYKPEPELLAQFILKQLRNPPPSLPPTPRPGPSDPLEDSTGEGKKHGAKIIINGVEFTATTVPDLYKKVLRYLCDYRYIEKLLPLLPYATSQKRYLLAHKPVHPHGNNFVVPIEYGGYYLEAHKDYKNAINQLKKLLNEIGINVEDSF